MATEQPFDERTNRDREHAALRIQAEVRKRQRRKRQRQGQQNAADSSSKASESSPAHASSSRLGVAKPVEVKNGVVVVQPSGHAHEGGHERRHSNTLARAGEDGKWTLTQDELKQLWTEYDRNRDGVLVASEVQRLAVAVNDRLLQLFREQLRLQYPNVSEKTLRKMVEKERPHLLVMRNGKKGSEVPEMARRLMRILDISHDGKVSQNEFLIRWNEFSVQTFSVIDSSQKPTSSLACVIL